MIILLLVTFIDLLGFGMIFPLLPLLKLQFALNDMQVGYLVSSFALFNLIGSMVFGILSDKIGRKYLLAVPLFFAAVAYYFTGLSESYGELLLLRAAAGFCTGNFSVAFACLSDLSTKENKFKNMSYLGISFSLGFILGPALGGLLAGNTNDLLLANFALPFNVAAFFTLLSAILAFIFLRETLSVAERKQAKHINIWTNIKQIYTNKTIILFTYLTILFSLILAGLEVYLSLWLNHKFLLTSQNLGLYWGGFSVVVALGQLLSPKLFPVPKKALIAGFATFMLGMASLVITNNFISLYFFTFVMALGMGMILPSINVNLSLQGNKNQQGMIFGINQSFGSLGRIIGPYLLGMLYFINPNLTWLATSFICLCSIFVIVKF
ncbi:MFS transporter [Candidatus Hepatincolaceae symbiont of Richtersius coronifer]